MPVNIYFNKKVKKIKKDTSSIRGIAQATHSYRERYLYSLNLIEKIKAYA